MSDRKETRKAVMRIVRQSRAILLIVVSGMLIGMAVRAWGVPRMPRVIRSLFGEAEEGTSGAKGEKGREIAFWKSTMIPNFVSPKPGVDPMNMELVPVYMDELTQESFITVSPQVMRNMGIRTAAVESGSAKRIIRTVGEVAYAEPLLGDVTLKVGGWVEELFVDYVGQRVKKGDPLFTIYSPELFSTVEEYLLSLKREESPRPPSRFSLRTDDIYSAYQKLRYWDVPESEIERFKREGATTKTVRFDSPFDGWVIEKHAFPGMYMKPGERFYRIADLSKMWVYVTIFEYQLRDVRVGLPARLSFPFRPGETFEGKVIYIYPFVDPATRQIRVRLEFPNPDLKLKPAMYADVTLESAIPGQHVLVDQDAVIQTGKHKIVDGVVRPVGQSYVMIEPGKFEAREVVLGEELEGGKLQVLGGLEAGEQVVVSGQFQLDSERRIKEANLAMLLQSRNQSKQEKKK